MKLTPLLISMLIFLMSGVMCLFPNSEVHAQVPQTKRSDQDSFLKNIRSKKKNNDLQKARRVKGRSNQKTGNKIRFRFISGDVLSGKKVELDSALGFYHSQISVLPEDVTPSRIEKSNDISSIFLNDFLFK